MSVVKLYAKLLGSFREVEPYSLRRCVNLEVWKTEMAHINPENKYVVLAVIKNILENTIETAEVF